MNALPERCDVVVIGGGVIGLSVAYFLARAGVEVAVLEQRTPGSQTSAGNCGLLTPSHADPLTQPGSLKAAARSLLDPAAPLRIAPTVNPGRIGWFVGFARRCNATHRWRAAQARSMLLNETRRLVPQIIGEEGLQCAFSEQGLMTIFRTQRALDADLEAHESMAELGVSYEVLDDLQLREREPLVREGMAGAIHATTDAHFDPSQYSRALSDAAQRHGAVVFEGLRVEGLREGAGEVSGVDTSSGFLGADHVVLAAGPWSAELAATVGARLPIQPAKGYSITWDRPVEPMGCPLYFFEPKVVATPWSHGFRVGSTMEFVGFDDSMNATRLGKLLEGARAFLDHPLELGPGKEWFGWAPDERRRGSTSRFRFPVFPTCGSPAATACWG